jgi:hypothetical protein
MRCLLKPFSDLIPGLEEMIEDQQEELKLKCACKNVLMGSSALSEVKLSK